MTTISEVDSAFQDPKSHEELYQKVRQTGETAQFASELVRRHSAAPDNTLLSAWFYRLQAEPASPGAHATRPAAAACFILSYLVISPSREQSPSIRHLFGSTRDALVVTVGLIAVTVYAYWMGSPAHEAYRQVAFLHLPVLAWLAIFLLIALPLLFS